MKLKDIEKNLKKEQDGKSVPDVYGKVSKAPLNKLLTGETPAKVFQKQLVMRLLVLVLVLFLAVAIGLSAIWLSPADAPLSPDCYISITVENADGGMRLGIISEGKSIVTVVVESMGGELDNEPIISHSSRIADFISPKDNDKVRIELLSVKSSSLSAAARYISGEIEFVYNGKNFEMTTSSNNASARSELKDYLERMKGAELEKTDVGSMIDEYVRLFV